MHLYLDSTIAITENERCTLHPDSACPASESLRASYTVCSNPESRQQRSTSFSQTIDLVHHDIPTQRASTTLQRAGNCFSWPTASSYIQSREVPPASQCSQVKRVHLVSASYSCYFNTDSHQSIAIFLVHLNIPNIPKCIENHKSTAP